MAQTIEIVPSKAGDFKVPAIKVSLNPETTPPAESAQPGTSPSASDASPSLSSEPFIIVVRPARTLFWISGGLGASLLLMVLGWLSARYLRGRQPIPRSGIDPNERSLSVDALDTALREARTKRLDGDFYGHYLALSRAAGYLPSDPARDSLLERLESRAREVGYPRPAPDRRYDGWR